MTMKYKERKCLKLYDIRLTGSLGSVDQSFADLTNGEHGRCLNIVPVFAGERVDTIIKQNTQSNHFPMGTVYR